MERNGEQKINTIIDAVFAQYGLTGRMREMRIINHWADYVDAPIAQATTKIDIFKRILFLKLNSAAVRNEILLRKSELIKQINEKSGHNIIDDIVAQ